MPTLRLKLIATTLSGALMGMAGAPLPYYVTYLDPTSSFNLAYAVNSVAMPVIGGMTSWVGPVIGAILLGTIQQLATVTISSALNLLFVGVLLIGFVIIAPNGIVGLVQARRRRRAGRTWRVSASERPIARASPGLGKRFGGFVALDGIDLTIDTGERLGLIGPNGSGKSTLVNCLCGTLRNETGSVVFDGKPLDGHDRASAHAARPRPQLPAAEAVPHPDPRSTISASRCSTRSMRGTGQQLLAPARSTTRCGELLHEVGLADKARRLPRDLTQVEMRKLELARAVATQPRLLFADEAMAGLSPSEVEEILAVLLRLNEQGITIVLIEHIMRAVMSFSTRLVVLVAGQKIADGDAAGGGPQPRGREGVSWRIASRSAGVNAGYGLVRVLEDISVSVSHAETVTLLGTNGNGKSTLMKCIMGMLRPQRGSITAEIDGERARTDRAAPPRTSSISASPWCPRGGACSRS